MILNIKGIDGINKQFILADGKAAPLKVAGEKLSSSTAYKFYIDKNFNPGDGFAVTINKESFHIYSKEGDDPFFILLPKRIKGKEAKEKYLEEGYPSFCSIYGYVKIDISYNQKEYQSDYIPVEQEDKELKKSVESMAEVLYRNERLFYLPSHSVSLAKISYVDIESAGPQNFFAKSENVVSVFEKNYGYYIGSALRRSVKKTRFDNFEKLHQLRNENVQYIVRNPQEFYEAKSGIKVGNRMYLPKRTLVDTKTDSYDVYENQVLLAFLKWLICQAEKCRKQSNDDNDKPNYIKRGFTSRCDKLLKQLRKIYYLYQQAHCVTEAVAVHSLSYTPAFAEIPQYREYYECMSSMLINKAFGFSDAFHEDNDFLSGYEFPLSFPLDADVYELYVMALIHESLIRLGYDREAQAFKKEFAVAGDESTHLHNYFCYKKGKDTFEIYYEPCFRMGDAGMSHEIAGMSHEIGIKMSSNRYILHLEEEGRYKIAVPETLTPDYVFKYTKGNEIRYIIADAKFSDYDTTEKNRLPECISKYLTCLSTIEESGGKRKAISGILLFSGKRQSGDVEKKDGKYYLPYENKKLFSNIMRLTDQNSEDGGDIGKIFGMFGLDTEEKNE